MLAGGGARHGLAPPSTTTHSTPQPATTPTATFTRLGRPFTCGSCRVGQGEETGGGRREGEEPGGGGGPARAATTHAPTPPGTAALFALEDRIWIPNVVAAVAFALSLAPPVAAAAVAKRKAAAAAAREEVEARAAAWEAGKMC